MSKKSTTVDIGAPPSALITAIQKILYPLVRLLLNFRIVFPQLSEILKGVYVEVAEKEFRLADKPQTDTRLSLLTGIHRKDIKRLRLQLSTDKKMPVNINVGGRLVSHWIEDENYVDENDQPRILPLKNPDGASFETLVQEVCKKDIRPRVILDEWLDQGVVTIDDNKNITLNTQAFIPKKGFDEKAFFLGHNISDHLAASTHNILNQHPPFFERCVYYDGLCEDSIEQLQTLVTEKGMETLIAFNELAMKLKARDTAKPTTNKQRIDIGLYVYHESEE